MKSIFTLLICLLTVLPLQSQFYNNRGRFEFARPYERTYRPKQKIQIRYDDAIRHTKPFNIHVDPGGLKDYSIPLVMNSYPAEEVENIECECHYGSDWDSFLSTLDSYIEQQLYLFIAEKEKILSERIGEIMGSDYKRLRDASFHFFRAINPANYKFDHQSSFRLEVNSNLNRTSNERIKTYVNHKILDALKKSIGRSKTDPLYHDFGDLEFNGVRMNDIRYVSWWTTAFMSSMAKLANDKYYFYRELKNADNNIFANIAISEYYRDKFMSHFDELGDLDRIKLVTQYLIDHHSNFFSCDGCQPEGFYIPPYSYSKYEGVVKKHIVKLDRDFPDMSLETAKTHYALSQMDSGVNNFASEYLFEDTKHYLELNNFGRASLTKLENYFKGLREGTYRGGTTGLKGSSYTTQDEDRPCRILSVRLSNGKQSGWEGFGNLLHRTSKIWDSNNVRYPPEEWFHWVEGETIRQVITANGLKLPEEEFRNIDLGRLFDFEYSSGNYLRIGFSNQMASQIIDCEHGDGKYGWSLFTDPLKIKALKDLLDGEEVDFSTRTGDIIINGLTGKARCVYKKLEKLSGGFRNIIKNFDGDFPVAHLRYSMSNDLDSKVNATTNNSGQYIIEIKINNKTLSDRTNLGLARTLIHETIHAELYRKVRSVGGSISINDFPGIYDYYRRFLKNWQHEQMAAHYRNTIINALKSFDNNQLPDQIYEDLSWEGLHKTESWNSLNPSEKERIIKNIEDYKNTGNKNCD